jgi:hypothetical protein
MNSSRLPGGVMQPNVRYLYDVIVTPDNFNRAETDRYFWWTIKLAHGIGRFHHRRDIMPIDWQTVVRPNRDTLYSAAVFDLDAAPVTITLPDSGGRFMSMLVIDEDHFAPVVVRGAGRYTLSREQIGTRYAMAVVRTLVDPRSHNDLQHARQLQDAISVDQERRGWFHVPAWDRASQKRVREALVALGRTIADSKGMFGTRAQVDPVRHLIGTALRWGGNPEEEATYLNVTPSLNDGTTVYRLTARDVPVDGFWSISVYDAAGYFEPNSRQTYSINSITAARSQDGSVTVQFGGWDDRTPNCLPIMPGWNYMVRLYRPRAEILDGRWVFPIATPVVKAQSRASHISRHAREARSASSPYSFMSA